MRCRQKQRIYLLEYNLFGFNNYSNLPRMHFNNQLPALP